MTQSVLLKGFITPILTPLNQQQETDVPALKRLVEHMLTGGVDGLFLFGSSGEGPALSQNQISIALQATYEVVQGQVPLLVGILETSTQRVIDVIRHIEKLDGADAIVVTTPYYFGTDDADHVAHFRKIAQSTTLPVILYNIPPMTHQVIAVSTIKALLELPNIVGIKDSAGDLDAFQQMLLLRQERPDFSVLQGAEIHAAQSLIMGANGIVAGLGNLVPEQFSIMVKEVQNGDQQSALERQDALNVLGQLHQHDYWLKCLKFAASLMGFGSGMTCCHANDLSTEAQDAIRQLVQPYLDVA